MLKSLVSKITSVTVIASALFYFGCSPDPITQEQLTKLQQLRDQERDLNKQIKEKQNEISNLEKELAAEQARLKECQKETEWVKGKLPGFPDVWPDWKPVQENEGEGGEE